MTSSAVSVLIVSVQTIVLIPLYLHAIGPRLYGAWLGSGDVLAWMQAFDLGLPNLLIQRVGAAHGKGDTKQVAEYFASGLLVLVIVAVAIVVAASILSLFLPDLMGLDGNEAHVLRSCFLLGSVAAGLNILSNGVVGFSRGIQAPGFMNALGVATILAGFATSLYLTLSGWGLWAIAAGLLVRAVVFAIGGLAFSAKTLLSAGMIRFFRLRRPILREFVVVSPITALGGISYALMNQSETALVAIFVSPQSAVVFAITRKAIDVGRGLVDTIAFASYGGFAHLVGSPDRHRAMGILREIRSLRFSLAIAIAAAYMAVNSSLISVWSGSELYGGLLLTTLMALQFIVVGDSYMMNYLYRATGQVVRGSIALLVEMLLRVPLMISLMLWLGLPGLPVAAILTALAFGQLAYRWIQSKLSMVGDSQKASSFQVGAARLAVFVTGLLIGYSSTQASWAYVLFTGSAVFAAGVVIFLLIDPVLDFIRRPLFAKLNRYRIKPS